MEHQITLNLDLKDSGYVLDDILKSLSPEKKSEIATKFIQDIIDQPLGKERADLEQELVNKFMEQKITRYGKDPVPEFKDEETVRANYKFRQELAKIKSPRQELLESTFRKIEMDLTTFLKAKVEASDEVNRIVEALRSSFLENMTTYVQNAMTTWFTEQMRQAINQEYLLEQRAAQLEFSLNDVLERLGLPPLLNVDPNAPRY